MNIRINWLLAALLFLAMTPWGTALAKTCVEMTETEVMRRGEELTTLVRIATFRADLNGMETNLGNLDQFLNSCSASARALACTPSCYFEQANVFLFKASDLPFLSSAGGGRVQLGRGNVRAADAARFVNEGVRRAEEGLRAAAKRRGSVQAPVGSGAPTAPTAATPASPFADYIANTAMLSGVIVRLKLTAGDLWYQELSHARLQHLDTIVTEASNRPPANPGTCKSGSELCTARAFYEDAMWTLIEAKSDVPDTNEFASTRLTLDGLESDLRRRLTSIKRGHLFLDLDPERFTTISSTELLDVLQDMQLKLTELEGKIDAMVQGWAHEKANQEQVKVDEARFFDGQQSALIGHKIAKLDTEGQRFATEIEGELNKLRTENEDWEYRRMLRGLQADLEKKRLDTEAQRRLVTARKGTELNAVRQDELLDQRSELRWLINAALTENSLAMQIGAFESQRLEFQSRIDTNKIRADQVRERIEQAQSSQQIARSEQSAATARLSQLGEERTKVFEATRKAMSTAICDIESSLTFLGETPTQPFKDPSGTTVCMTPSVTYTKIAYQKEICDPTTGLRQRLATDRVLGALFLRKCVVGITAAPPGADQATVDRHNGITCPADLPGEYKIAKDIAATEKSLRDQNAKDLGAKLTQLQKYVSDLHDAVTDYRLLTAGAESILGIAETALILGMGVPDLEISTYAAGMCTGIATSINPTSSTKKSLQAAYEVAKQVFDLAKERSKDDRELIEKFGKLQLDVADLKATVDNIKLKDTLAEAEAGKVIAEIMGRESTQRQEILSAQLQRSTVIADCHNAASDLDLEIGRLRAEHTRQVAQLTAELARNDSLRHAENAERARFESAQAQERLHKSQERELNLELTALAGDTATIVKLDGAVADRIASTQSVRTDVTRLNQESTALNRFLTDLRGERSRLAMGVDAIEQGRLVDLLNKEETSVDSERKAIFARMESSNLELGLKEKLKESNRQALAEIAKLRDAMIAGAEKTITNGRGERERIFVVSAEELTDMVAGVPEYIRAKKALVGAVNTAMSNLRSRFKTLAGLAGDATELRKIPYIRTAAELGAVMQDFCRRSPNGGTHCVPQSGAPFYDERQVETYSETFVVPGASGLARALVRNGEATLRIAPLDGRTSEELQRSMAAKGYFTMWAPQFTAQNNLVLTDVVVGFDYPCTTISGNRIHVAHQGDGVLFRSLGAGTNNSVPVMMSDAPRSWKTGIFDLKNGEMAKYNDRVAAWKGDFQMRNFPETRKNPDGTDAPLPFLGAPLVATYKLAMKQGTCNTAGADMKITFAYAGKVN